MSPVTPIIPGCNLPVVVYAKDQPEYKPFPVYKNEEGALLSRWKLTLWERLKLLFTGNLYLWILTFNKPLQPINLGVNKPYVSEG